MKRKMILRSETKRYANISLLEKMSCIHSMLKFLSIADLRCLGICKKNTFKSQCEKQICHMQEWDVRKTPNCNLDDVWNIKIRLLKKDREIPNLGLLKHVKTMRIFGFDRVVLDKQQLLPPSLTSLTSYSPCRFPNFLSWPNNLQKLSILREETVRFGVPSFPLSLTSLAFSSMENLEPGILPSSLLYLCVTFHKCTELTENIIPQNVVQLSLTNRIACKLAKNCLPPNLKSLTLDGHIDNYFALDFVFPQKMRMLSVRQGFSNLKDLPSKLRSLLLWDCSPLCFCVIKHKLPPSLRSFLAYISDGGNYHNLTLQFSQLKRLTLNNVTTEAISLISTFTNLRHLKLNLYTKMSVKNLTNLKTLYVSYKTPNASITGCDKLIHLTGLHLHIQVNDRIVLPSSLVDLVVNSRDLKHKKKGCWQKIKIPNGGRFLLLFEYFILDV